MSEPFSEPVFQDNGPSQVPGPDAVPVCPQCMAENLPNADFCRACGAPLSSLAAMDPLKQVYAQGWIYRQAVARPTSWIVLLGMWLIFGAAAFVIAISLLPWRQDPASWRNTPWMSALSVVFSVGFLALYTAILCRLTGRYLQHRMHSRPGLCPQCGYDLTGLPDPRCPECGTPFDPEEVFGNSDDDEPPGARQETPRGPAG